MATRENALERITRVEDKIDHVCTDLSELKQDFKDFIKSCDSKYASKNVEKFVYGLIGAVMLSVLYFVLAQAGIK